MKKIKSLSILVFLSVVIIACSQNTKNKNENEVVSANETIKSDSVRIKPIHDKVYTRASDGKNVYKGKTQEILGYIGSDVLDRNDIKLIGKIGTIDAQGNIKISLPKEVSDSLLRSRGNDDVLGGVLVTQPELQLWKGDDDIMVITYLNKDLQYMVAGEDYGLFPQGWSYARKKDHLPRADYADYKWVLFNNSDKIQSEISK